MLSSRDRWQGGLFVAGSLGNLVPDANVLRKVDGVLDLSWLREEVKDLYCLDNGRSDIDPKVGIRLMLAGLPQGIAHDRALLREAQVNLAIRWSIGYRLHEELPHHSSLTRTRGRWGMERCTQQPPSARSPSATPMGLSRGVGLMRIRAFDEHILAHKMAHTFLSRPDGT